MASSSGPNYIDGFSSVQAVKRSKTAGQGLKSKPSESKLQALNAPAVPAKAEGSPAKKISRSTIPEKFILTCYECEYVFTTQGRVIDTFCPKCRKKLEAKNVTISGDWSQNIRTIGWVEISSGAVVKDCQITARDLLLRGNATAARLIIHNKLELSSGAQFNMEETVIRSLVIARGSSITLKNKLRCDSIEIFGSIKAAIKAEKRAVLEAEGYLNGSLESPALIIYEGAGMKAKLKIGAGRK